VKFLRPEKRGKGSIWISLGLHAVLFTALLGIVFRYPLGQLMGIPEPEHENLQFIAVPQQVTENSGGRASPKANAAPARLVAPPVTPTQLPIPNIAVDAAPARAAGGDGDGFGVSGSGLATGIVPRRPDPRIALLAPEAIYQMPRGVSEDVDSIIALSIGIVLDSLEILEKQGKLPEWVKRTKGGNEWGLTPTYIALGKLKIPTALLALLPLNVGPGRSPVDMRTAAYIRRDVLENANRSISEDAFRQSVKRIRERKERERREAEAKQNTKQDTKTPDPKPIPSNQVP
jgi:hypothetical protein